MKPIIEVKNVSKKFIIPHEKENSLRNTILNFYKKKTYETFYALKDVSFTINKGEFIGIIGRNGSGKSTLLKILAGIYQPDSGQVIVREKISPFLELGVGFNGELSGRDNIYLYGAVLGLSKEDIDSKFNEIVKFAELEKFIDMKMKNYSSGMYVRLAFSVAIQADAPILIVDEVLAVGDANFQQKCFDVFERYKKEGKTIVFVSHDTGSMRRFCDKIILLEEGMLAKQGKPNEIIDFYIRGNSKESSDTKLISISKVKDNKKIEEEIEKEIILKIRKDPLNTIYKEKYNIIKYAEEIDKNEDFSIITLNTLNSNNKKTEEFNSKEDIILEFIIKASKNNNDLQIGIQIFSETGIELLGFTNTMLKDKLMLKKGLNKVKFRMGNLNVLSCKLLITYALFSDLENKIKYYHYSWNKNHIKIKSSSEFEGILDPRISIKK